MLGSLQHASALVIGSAIYFYLFSVLRNQPRPGKPDRWLLALVVASGIWYAGNLLAVYFEFGAGREQSALKRAAFLLANAGGWLAWPIGIRVSWYALRRKEHQFLAALVLCGAVSGVASLKYPLGSLPTVLATLPTPIAMVWFLDRRQVFGLYLPRSAVVAGIFGGGTALYIVLVQPLATALRTVGAREDATRMALLFGGVIAMVPLFNLLLAREARRLSQKREKMRDMITDAARIFDFDERVGFFENRTREDFGFKSVHLVFEGQEGRPHFTHRWPLESEGRRSGWLSVDAGARRRLDEDEPMMEMLAQEVAYSLGTMRLLEDKIKLERELLGQEHLASLGKVAAAIAHEIKNPLSAIKTITQLMLEDSRVGETHQRDLRYILSETDRLARSMKQLLGFARPVDQVESSVELSALVSNTTAVLARQGAEGGIRVKAEIEAGWVLPRGNPELVSPILLNLILNAMQAAPPGTEVMVELKGAGAGSGAVELTVTDQGPGIPQELKDRIFEPFYTTRQKGTGLGLAIVVKSVHHLGGGLELESPVTGGGGTRFRVRFPGAVHRDTAAGDKTAAEVESA